MNANGFQLTDHEKKVLGLVSDGLKNAEIARDLKVSAETIKSELKRIFRKIGVKNRTQAAVLCVREGLIKPSRS
ncbi:MAG: helix-turn-helix transcriptional regulator [Patescibacteria group bacterium]|jgi:DNA-binding NarL/FixJ family response regulator